MNNKGFTLIELLITISIISLITLGFMTIVNNTFSLSNEKAYDITKNNIIKQAETYINECENNILNCENDYNWTINDEDKETSFYLSIMKKYDYFSRDEYINPITKKDMSDCLEINVIKDKYDVLNVFLDDSKC